MDKQVGILDIGTNTTLLLTARWDAGQQAWTDIQTQQRFTRIGERLKDQGQIPAFVMERNLECLREYKTHCQAHGITQLYAFGTSALRDASNGADFARLAKMQLNIDVQIISGQREAELICKSVADLYQNSQQPLYILDIGGGSTELIQWQDQQIKFLKSLNLGVVHLTAEFFNPDPPSPTQIEQCRKYLANLFQKNYPPFAPGKLVAIGGTATSAFGLIEKLTVYEPEKVEGKTLQLSALENLFSQLSQLSPADRIHEPQLPAKRADVFLAGLLILMEELKVLNVRETLVSDRGLRYGVLEELL